MTAAMLSTIPATILAQTLLTLRLNFRNLLAVLYGFVFPLIFLAAFVALYRHEPVAAHMGELLTVTVLGGACFGLPTALVAEREQGVWRSYRLTPVPTWAFLAAVLLARLVLILLAGALQLAVAAPLGLTLPTSPFGLVVAFLATSFAFMGIGLVIAMVAKNVATVQALGQCVFLPMLIIGGVAVPIRSLPHWAERLSLFLPGRYAVEAMQATISGGGLATVFFPLVALVLTGLVAAFAAARMTRWNPEERLHGQPFVLGAAFLAWLAIGGFAWWRGAVPPRAIATAAPALSVARAPTQEGLGLPSGLPPQAAENDGGTGGATGEAAAALPPPAASAAGAQKSAAAPRKASPGNWRAVGPADIADVAFERLPPDSGIVAPVALFDEAPDPSVQPLLDRLARGLPDWAPGGKTDVPDPVQRVRNMLCVAAVPDLLQMETVERFVPVYVFADLRAAFPPQELQQLLYWVAFHPEEGTLDACGRLAPLGLPEITDYSRELRNRISIYALKLLGRMTGNVLQK